MERRDIRSEFCLNQLGELSLVDWKDLGEALKIVYSWLCFAFDPAGNCEGTYAQCISNALPFGRTLSELS
jgi:hypothetical protein